MGNSYFIIQTNAQGGINSMKFQAPKLGKQKELDNAEYLLMINEYMDTLITRLQNMSPTDNGWNIKTKRYPDGLRLKAKFRSRYCRYCNKEETG